ncbi:MAG: 12-oxophytodienoate reductase [Rhizobiales bacterium 65-9]|nr:MAG: 12-oxophytodienoate reductase [Rhizobiales bacterium 65-9]
MGSVTLANRIVMSPMTRGFSPGGAPNEAVANYYARRAAGGAGLIVTEGVGVDHPSALGDAGLGENDIPFMFGERSLSGWRSVVDAVHAAGGKIAPQLWHQGVMRIRGTGPSPDAPTIGPSGVWGPRGVTTLDVAKIPSDPVLGDPMTDEEIEDVVASFARAGRDAVSVGFDGVALHGGHGYLLDNFLWEGTNAREDRWGGDRRRRSEAVVAIVRGLRREIGDALPIIFRFSQWKQQDYKARLAQTPQELEEVLGPIADAGVDVFDASVRYFDTPAFPGSEMGLAGWAKKVTGKLSMTVGGVGINKDTGLANQKSNAPVADIRAVDNIDLVARRFERGEFDLVAVGRAMIGDAEWANKIFRNESPRAYDARHLAGLH